MVPVGDMFQRKMDELFQGQSNVFGIADNILIAGFDDMGRYHNATLNKMQRVCRWTNLKLNKRNAYSHVKHTILQ